MIEPLLALSCQINFKYLVSVLYSISPLLRIYFFGLILYFAAASNPVYAFWIPTFTHEFGDP